MSNDATRAGNESAYDLFDRWMALGRRDNDAVAPARTEVAFEEFAHPVPMAGGTAGAPVFVVPEPTGEAEPLLAPAPAPVTVGASVPRPADAPAPDLVLLSPRRGFRHALTGAAAFLAAGVGIAGYLAWQDPTPVATGIGGALVAVLFLTWALRSRTQSSQVSVEDGVLRIIQGDNRHQFPLIGTHPAIDVVGEPGQRDWQVQIQRRGMSPFVITSAMVDPTEFTEVLRHFRPRA